ncbi:hypothetical protein SAMN05421856_103303 [Chryseobacterium taichungense]|uniref:Uncharacterized protein n=1 Tax=Chryseobacterium taichungense TaxID=295069 RepID=A0A1H7YI16_9FLAO|nr:hypothetical protein SAMN05421856_103303 [Chryseobacterium taichungense]
MDNHEKMWITTSAVLKMNENRRFNSELHSPENFCFFGITVTLLSELRSPEFGIALTEKTAQNLCHKRMQCLIKSILKVIKKSFFIKKENVDKKFASKRKK